MPILSENILPGHKVRLVSDYTNEWGESYKSGQTGVVLFNSLTDKTVTVEFDGYEEEKQEAQKLLEEMGEGPNIVVWLSRIPTELCEPLGKLEED